MSNSSERKNHLG